MKKKMDKICLNHLKLILKLNALTMVLDIQMLKETFFANADQVTQAPNANFHFLQRQLQQQHHVLQHVIHVQTIHVNLVLVIIKIAEQFVNAMLVILVKTVNSN